MHVPQVDKAQFRTDPKLIGALRKQGLNPNEVAKRAFEAEARRILADDWLTRLRELQKGMKPFDTQDVVRAIREMRDGR